MHRLLIVDDEVMIADGLHEIIAYTKDLELDIYKVYSSPEALELIERNRFDIVLTDIRMPGMNGLQLAEQLRAKWPKCRIIFLTGHHEFEYVYSAIQHDRVNYLLKTEGYDKIIETIRHAIRDIEQQFKSEEMLAYAHKQQAKVLDSLRQQLVIDLLKERVSSDEEIDELFSQLQMPLDAARPVLVLLGSMKQLPKQLSYGEKSRLYYELEWIAHSYFQDFEMAYMLIINEDRLLWLIQPPYRAQAENESDTAQTETDWRRLHDALQEHLDQLQHAFCKAAGTDVSFVLDHSAIPWSRLPERYEQLSLLFLYRIGSGDTQLIMSADMANGEQRQLMSKAYVKPLKYEQLNTFLQNGQAGDFFALLNELSQQMVIEGTDNQTEEIYLTVALIYFSYINRWNAMNRVSERIRLQRLLSFKEHDSKEQAAAYLADLGRVLFDLQNEAEEERADSVISKLQAYIYDHLHDADKLSLIHLAEITYFNASYLSRLFKQSTGANLSDFIVNARIDRAKQLLALPNMKIQDVAERVGYSSATNFTRFFRRLTGMTPQDYRATLLQ